MACQRLPTTLFPLGAAPDAARHTITPEAGLRILTGSLGVLLACVFFAAPAAAQGVSLMATAGLDGQVRPGRWAPVRVEVANGSGPLTGELVVEWSDAHVTRPITLADEVPRQFELYVRTIDPRDVITVRFEADGARLAEAEIPVRVVGYDPALPPFVVCGARWAAAQGAPQPCTSTLEPEAVPRSWRGLSGADELRFSPADLTGLDAAQRLAVGIAGAQAQLNLVGLGSPVLGPVPVERRFPGRSSTLLGGYLLAVVAALVVAQWRRSSAMTLGLLLLAGAAGSASVYASGHFGTGSSLLIHHAATIDQYEGADGSLVTMRAVVEFPGLDQYAIRADTDDAALSIASEAGRATLRFDSSGAPLLAGTFGLGWSREFTFEGVFTPALLRVDRTVRAVRISNLSAATLRNCVFSGAFVAAAPTSIAAGASATATMIEDELDPTLTCALDELPWRFSEPRHPVVMDGTASVILHLNPWTGDAAAGSDR